MKKGFAYLFAVVLSMTYSCSDQEKGPDPTPVIDLMTQSTWRVTEYIIDGGISVANPYSGYDFTFAPDLTVTASDGSATVPGIWDVRNFDNEQLKFIIDFPTPEVFTYLTNSWRIRYRSADKIILDINEFNYVVFEKN